MTYSRKIRLPLSLLASFAFVLVQGHQAVFAGADYRSGKVGNTNSGIADIFPSGRGLRVVKVRSDKRIDGLSFDNGDIEKEFGGKGGREYRVYEINRNTCISGIIVYLGTARHIRETQSIFGLKFIMFDGNDSPLYGSETGNKEVLSAANGREITGFEINAGREIDAIGILTTPVRSICRR